MKRMICIAWLVSAVCSPGIALGQETDKETEEDTTVSATVRARSGYSGRITGDLSRFTLTQELTTLVPLRPGWRIRGRLGTGESFYRLQDREDASKSLTAQLFTRLGRGLTVRSSATDRRFFNRAVTFSGDVQRFTNNSQRADTRIRYRRRGEGTLQIDAWGEGGVVKSEQTFLDDLYREGSLVGEVAYSVGDRVSISTRGFLRKTSNDVEARGITVGGLGIEEDSLGTTLSITVAEDATVDAYYHRFAFSNRFMDLPRGVFLEQQFGEELVPEHETRTAEIMRVSAVAKPNERLQLIFGAEHSEMTSRFATALKRNSETVTEGFRAVVVYDPHNKLKLRVSMDNFEVLHDLGPNSLGTFTDKRQGLRANLGYRATETLNLQLGLSTSLLQNFYREFEVNPRDRDQLEQAVDVVIASRPFPKISAQISLIVRQADFVNISGSLSENNRRETTYDFRPEVGYRITERIELRQRYGLNIEFTEYAFTENENFLDRNFTFGNMIRVQLSRQLSTTLDYSLLLHDRGSYLRPAPGEERLLRINQEDRRDHMAARFRYQLTREIALLGGHDFTTRRVTTPGGPPSSAFREGGLEIGAEGGYNWSARRNFRFRIVKVNRFGRLISGAQRDYWMVDSMLNFGF